ncbi:MAG: 6-phospho-3-hexuloisomerase [Faecousia sp.]
MNFAESYQYYAETVLEEHKSVFDAQNLPQLEAFVKTIAAAQSIFVVGAGREGIAARSFAMRLMHLGKKVHWVWDDTTPGMKSGDLFLAVDGSGRIGHIDYLAERAAANGASIGIITGDPNQRIPQAADHLLFVPAAVYKGTDPRVVPSIQPMGNLFEQHLFLLFDVMVMLLRDEMGMTCQQMESRHRNIE